MPRIVIDDVTGVRFVQTESGELIPAEEASLLAQAGRQFADIGSGIQAAYGELTDDQAMVARAQADTAARNQAFRGTDIADPYTSMVGQALPGLATAPMSGLMTGLALGAAESALDYGEGGTFGQRAAAGATGAFIGDMAGRVMARGMNLAEGLSQALAGRPRRRRHGRH